MEDVSLYDCFRKSKNKLFNPHMNKIVFEYVIIL